MKIDLAACQAHIDLPIIIIIVTAMCYIDVIPFWTRAYCAIVSVSTSTYGPVNALLECNTSAEVPTALLTRFQIVFSHKTQKAILALSVEQPPYLPHQVGLCW